jgi:hypothetical protein
MTMRTMRGTMRKQVLASVVVALAALVASQVALAVDLRIATYNVANHPNDQQDIDDLTTIISAMGDYSAAGSAQRIDILALQETDTDSIIDTVTIFNGLYVDGAYLSASSASAGGGDRTGFVYDSTSVSLLETLELGEGLGMEQNVLRGKFRPVGTAGAEDFYVYAVHLKSGTAAADEDQRQLEATILRADADGLGADAKVIYAGDYNWNDFDENTPDVSAYETFVSAGNGQGIDLAFEILGATSPAGDWRDNPDYLSAHTNDPGGAMDDRFDVIFTTDEFFDDAGLDYVDNTFTVFGNNGTHTLNAAISTGSGASPGVLLALERFSDHLPIFADFSVGQAIPEPATLAVWSVLGIVLLSLRRRS